MTSTLAASSWFVLLALLPGCSEQPVVQPRSQGLLPGEEAARTPKPVVLPHAPVPPPRQPVSSLASPFAKANDPGSLSKPQAAPSAQSADASAQAAGGSALAEATKPRDLPAELTALLGQPASCLDLDAVAAAGGRTTLAITVQVMPSGRVTRASASAPNQGGDALHCLENRAGAVSFRAPVPGAPTEVTATIPIEVVAQPAAR